MKTKKKQLKMSATGLRTFDLRMRHAFIKIELLTLKAAEYVAMMFQTKLMNVLFIVIKRDAL